MVLDYLYMHGPLIAAASYIEEPFTVPSNVEELAPLLPGNTQFDNVDDLLITIGKQHDRSLLHAFASKLFKVPQRLLVEAEKGRKALVPSSVLDAVYESRRRARDAAKAAVSDQPGTIHEETDATTLTEWPKPSLPIDAVVTSAVNGTEEYADPERICKDCLPVYGDEIVGTKPENDPDTIAKVHRVGCPHAQRAINKALVGNQRSADGVLNFARSDRVDSVTLRRSVTNRVLKRHSVAEVPVKLQWADFSSPEEQSATFMCEVAVHAQDRKLLLADCSEIVSELSEIVKTGSQTTNEHATLVFLVNIQGLEHLQKLMDSLQQVRAVMSVERRVSIDHDFAFFCGQLC